MWILQVKFDGFKSLELATKDFLENINGFIPMEMLFLA